MNSGLWILLAAWACFNIAFLVVRHYATIDRHKPDGTRSFPPLDSAPRVTSGR